MIQGRWRRKVSLPCICPLYFVEKIALVVELFGCILWERRGTVEWPDALSSLAVCTRGQVFGLCFSIWFALRVVMKLHCIYNMWWWMCPALVNFRTWNQPTSHFDYHQYSSSLFQGKPPQPHRDCMSNVLDVRFLFNFQFAPIGG